MFGALHCIVWLRNLDSKKPAAELFEGLRNVMMEEGGEDKMRK